MPSGAAEHVGMHMACLGAKLGPICVISDIAPVGKAKLVDRLNLERKGQHTGFWERQGRIKELVCVKSHSATKQGFAAGFKKEWIDAVNRLLRCWQARLGHSSS